MLAQEAMDAECAGASGLCWRHEHAAGDSRGGGDGELSARGERRKRTLRCGDGKARADDASCTRRAGRGEAGEAPAPLTCASAGAA
eukprot:2875566-Pleurochrysis_carterae.AAC.2